MWSVTFWEVELESRIIRMNNQPWLSFQHFPSQILWCFCWQFSVLFYSSHQQAPGKIASAAESSFGTEDEVGVLGSSDSIPEFGVWRTVTKLILSYFRSGLLFQTFSWTRGKVSRKFKHLTRWQHDNTRRRLDKVSLRTGPLRSIRDKRNRQNLGSVSTMISKVSWGMRNVTKRCSPDILLFTSPAPDFSFSALADLAVNHSKSVLVHQIPKDESYG